MAKAAVLILAVSIQLSSLSFSYSAGSFLAAPSLSEIDYPISLWDSILIKFKSKPKLKDFFMDVHEGSKTQRTRAYNLFILMLAKYEIPREDYNEIFRVFFELTKSLSAAETSNLCASILQLRDIIKQSFPEGLVESVYPDDPFEPGESTYHYYGLDRLLGDLLGIKTTPENMLTILESFKSVAYEELRLAYAVEVTRIIYNRFESNLPFSAYKDGMRKFYEETSKLNNFKKVYRDNTAQLLHKSALTMQPIRLRVCKKNEIENIDDVILIANDPSSKCVIAELKNSISDKTPITSSN